MVRNWATTIAVIAFVAVLACAHAGSRFDDARSLRELFIKLQGERVALHGSEGTDTVSVSTLGDGGDWTVCQVGEDFVRFCHRERHEAIAYPMTDLYLRTEGPGDD